MGKSNRPPQAARKGFTRNTCALAWFAVAIGGCSPEQPQPRLISISPHQGYTDQVTLVRITGSNFVPAYQFDLEENQATVKPDVFLGEVFGSSGKAKLSGIVWRSPSLLEAVLEKGLAGPAEAYNVTIVDPRGQAATLFNGFVSLGADADPPTITVQQPDPLRPVAAGNIVPVDFTVADVGAGSLQNVTYVVLLDGIANANGLCDVGTQGTPTRCRFQAQVPAGAVPGQIFEIRLNAVDASAKGNLVSKSIQFKLVPAPVLLSGTPGQGPATGGTDILIKGEHFPPDAKAFIDGVPLEPNGGTWLDSETIFGRSPPGRVGRVSVEIRALTGNSTLSTANDFSYLQDMSIDDVDPASGPTEGGIGVRVTGKGFTPNTVIVFGDHATTGTPLIMAAIGVPLKSSQRVIEGNVPAGIGSTSVWAVDPILGKTRWMGTFRWLPEMTKVVP
jgi:hypothetical protein